MERKAKFEDYSEEEFTLILEEIYQGKGEESYQDELIDLVCSLSEHPDGSDLIFYNKDKHITPKGIVAEIKTWRTANNKPGFKS